MGTSWENLHLDIKQDAHLATTGEFNSHFCNFLTGEHHNFSQMAEKVVQFCEDSLKEVNKAVIFCLANVNTCPFNCTPEVF